jgi:hypothetical protein
MEVLALAYQKYFPHLPPPVTHGRPQMIQTNPPPTHVNTPLRPTFPDFPLLHRNYLYQWQHTHLSNNLRIATLNLRGSPYSLNNDEPHFLHSLMSQLGTNILGITDAHLPPDLIDKATATIRRALPPDTAIITFPTTRPTPNSYRQNTMGGQFFIIDQHWAKWVGHKRVEPSGLALVASIRITYANTTLTVIQAMVPPYSKEPFSMWNRLKLYLEARGSTDTPRQYIMNTLSRWHLSELISGRP